MKERGKHTHRKKTRKRRVSEGSLFLPLINISIIHIIKLYVTIFNSFPSPCLLSLTTHITHHTHHVFTRKPRNREKSENPIDSQKMNDLALLLTAIVGLATIFTAFWFFIVPNSSRSGDQNNAVRRRREGT